MPVALQGGNGFGLAQGSSRGGMANMDARNSSPQLSRAPPPVAQLAQVALARCTGNRRPNSRNSCSGHRNSSSLSRSGSRSVSRDASRPGSPLAASPRAEVSPSLDLRRSLAAASAGAGGAPGSVAASSPTHRTASDSMQQSGMVHQQQQLQWQQPAPQVMAWQVTDGPAAGDASAAAAHAATAAAAALSTQLTQFRPECAGPDRTTATAATLGAVAAQNEMPGQDEAQASRSTDEKLGSSAGNAPEQQQQQQQ